MRTAWRRQSRLSHGDALVIDGVVVSEMLISSTVIGYLISRYRTILESAHVFAGWCWRWRSRSTP